jgi:DNA-directed RNA polymerase specialized sigma subunit
MEYKQLIKLSEEHFRRKIGIKKKTFDLMLKVLKEKDDEKKIIGGAPSKLSIERKLLITLEYLREYRTLFHIATDNGISESYCSRLIRNVENTLIKSSKFNLPKRKEKLLSENSIEVFLVDATETPIERPKKN